MAGGFVLLQMVCAQGMSCTFWKSSREQAILVSLSMLVVVVVLLPWMTTARAVVA